MALHLTYRRYALPFRAPVRTAHGIWAERTGLIVKLEGAAGRVGYGEVAPIPWFGTETVEESEAALKILGEWMTPEQIAAVPAKLGCLRFALAGACAGLDEGVGAKSERPDYLPVAALLPVGRAALTQIAPKAELGFRTFKWKVGVGDIADELSLLDDVIAELPMGAKLRLDANGAWDRRQAARWLERAAERPVEFVEQPIAHDARGADDALRGLAGDFPTPIALDESLVGARDVERWLAADWPGIFVIKPSLLGEPAPVMARLATAKADVVFSSALETVVGAKSALQLAFAWKGKRRALGFGVWPLFADNVFDGPFPAPFIRPEDVSRLNPEAAWTALS
ncbi:MAG TPA: o-succinylbenzoate synthase [Rariglobus sp.]|jgi:O-succinylbenzoate synthase|nr:o-succinylbenzoate synthase [Rariglobus sp.]